PNPSVAEQRAHNAAGIFPPPPRAGARSSLHPPRPDSDVSPLNPLSIGVELSGAEIRSDAHWFRRSPDIGEYSKGGASDRFAKMSNLNITNILEKMTGKDKDYRYMATSDLLSELNKESFKADQDLEPKLTSTVLQQLEDASGDVSGLAVKCLAPLVKKVGEDKVVEMTNKLCDKLINGKEQHRD
ncbi:unnamed protein product, partial [Urochloa humidicola]